MQTFWQKYQLHIETLFVLLLAASVRLTSLNVFRVVDEEDRWAWAVDFYRALLAGDLPATLVGDGYPGIFPVWLETIWLFLVSLYRSAWQGQWFGDEGVYLLIHEWSRTNALWLQRFPVVLANMLLVVIIFLYTRKLFGRYIALLAAVLISLDPFYLSDSRVNRAEALLTGLMMISLLALIAAHREPKRRRHLLASGFFGGLAWLTKSQALVLLPMFGVISLIWHIRVEPGWLVAGRRWLVMMLAWVGVAMATFIALWPATWTIPGPTFELMYNYVTRKVGEEGVKIFFLGRTVLDEDPGLIFYPVIFILRTTPLMLLGLLLGVWLVFKRVVSPSPQPSPKGRGGFSSPPVGGIEGGKMWRNWLDDADLWALLAYVLLYVGGMSLGGHKQDRFLMTAFPALNILAAAAFVTYIQQRQWVIRRAWIAGGVFLAIQLLTALPFHPYYFSYFNPLVGGGPVASQLTRIGWGEGMDQVADYLQSQPNPEDTVVATRFFHYLLGFKGKRINLDNDGDWVRADKIVFYIQQYQRMLDPSPGVIRYFMGHVPPEKVITIDNIDYAKIFPNPIQYPANPLVDRLEGELSLFGYRWEDTPDNGAVIRLIWENLSNADRPIAVRLWINPSEHSPWQPCTTGPAFEAAARTPGEVVESECLLTATNIPPGLYDLQVGVRQPNSTWLPLEFASGWSAVSVTVQGGLRRVSPEVAFAQLADEAVPATATPLEHTYADRVRLLAYELSSAAMQPGDKLDLTLYWQALRALDQDAHISVQAFLGEERVSLENGPPLDGKRPTSSWHPGEVISETWSLELPGNLPAPALVRLDVGLFLPDRLIPLPVKNAAGEEIPGAIADIRLEPETRLTYEGENPLDFTFGNTISLIGYEGQPVEEGKQLDIGLTWRAVGSPDGDYTAFLHLLNPEGELIAQSDVLPANGLFPTSAWQPGDVVQSRHHLELPANLAPGRYTLLAGLYSPAYETRLPVSQAGGFNLPDNAAPIGQTSLPLTISHEE